VKLTVEHKLTPRELAEAFCEMNDEDQAQFFIECADVAKAWTFGAGSYGADWQWFTVGRHLATCECSNDDARDMVREIARAASGETP
jgi:hypothetical protein